MDVYLPKKSCKMDLMKFLARFGSSLAGGGVETLDGGVRTCDSIFCPIVLLDIACSSSWNDHGRDSLCSLLAQVKQCLFFL